MCLCVYFLKLIFSVSALRCIILVCVFVCFLELNLEVRHFKLLNAFNSAIISKNTLANIQTIREKHRTELENMAVHDSFVI